MITNESRGRWLVQTATALYELDLDTRTIRRTPGGPDLDAFTVAQLRKDEEVIPLLALEEPVLVGRDMRLLLQIRADGVQTRRRTTPVRDIIELQESQ